MSRPVVFRDGVDHDIRSIRSTLNAATSGLGDEFLTRLGEQLDLIESLPELYGKIWRTIRAAPVGNTQYVIYYSVTVRQIRILCVSHGARDPGVWKSRA